MLQFIFGRPASGKTYTVLNKIKELTKQGEKSVLIVPEQFTFESEKAVAVIPAGNHQCRKNHWI